MEKKKYGMPAAAFLLATYLLLTLVFCLQDGKLRGLIDLFTLDHSVILVLCFSLFIRRRDTLLLSVLGMLVLVHLNSVANILKYYFYDSYWDFECTWNVIIFIGYVALFLLGLVLCEPSFIQKDMIGLRRVVRRLFFVPAVLLAFAWLFAETKTEFRLWYDWESFLWTAQDILAIVSVLLIGKWLAYPRVKTVIVQPELALLQKLLVMGTITLEEYDAKEQQLLDNARSKLAEETEK